MMADGLLDEHLKVRVGLPSQNLLGRSAIETRLQRTAFQVVEAGVRILRFPCRNLQHPFADFHKLHLEQALRIKMKTSARPLTREAHKLPRGEKHITCQIEGS